MSRSLCKPYYVSMRNRKPIKTFLQELVKQPATLLSYNYAMLRNYGMMRVYPHLTTTLKKYHIKRYFYKHKLWPHSNDTILRIGAFLKTWQIITPRIYIQRSSDCVSYYKDLVMQYFTGREMHGLKFGEFTHTRVYEQFRSQVDKKKIDKLHRDIAKAQKMRVHWAKENARLLKKARAETKSRGRSKVAIKKK